MNPGDTILGLDFNNHLWIVISAPVQGHIALVNLTTHTTGCIDDSCHMEPGDHPFVTRRSCVYYRRAIMNPLAPLLEADARGILRRHEPLVPDLLRRVQLGALASRFTAREVKAAVQATLDLP